MDLLGGLSHELRQPLQALVGHLDLLRRGSLGSLTSEQEQALDAVAMNAERVLRIAEDVLQVARIDAGLEDVVADEVDLRALLLAETEHARPRAQKKGLELGLDCPAGTTVSSDGGKLARIVANLLSNAIKYTAQGRVDVRGGPGFIEVADTGPGIPEDQREAVFDEYVRLEPGREPGTGLGLAIVRRLARLLGAEVAIRSGPGGTTLRLDLPPA
ncbi:MAG: sensor histidine kinase [Planctomycetota bacterium]|jgi:signal transduction histidine kinase